jgi:DNA anti-recombination protein RmuC
MIIDSKIPLVGYERLIEASDETEREVCGGQFVATPKGISRDWPASGTRKTRSWRHTIAR